MAPTRKNLKSKKAKLSLRKKGGKKSMKRVGRKAAKKTMKKGGNKDKEEFDAAYNNWKIKCTKPINKGATYVRTKINYLECSKDLKELTNQHKIMKEKEEDKENNDENFGEMMEDAEDAIDMTPEEAAELERQSKEESE
jgi:hypothetical protein